MSESREILEELAEVLGYPTPGYAARLEACHEQVRRCLPDGRDVLAEFDGWIADKPLEQLEELYISTFDLNPACTLDLGWHLFGEDYNRGRYLVKLRREMRQHGIAETEELPDHLSLALRLLARMKPEDAADFATLCVGPALEKIIGAMPQDNPFQALLETVKLVLEAAFGPITEECEHGATA